MINKLKTITALIDGFNDDLADWENFAGGLAQRREVIVGMLTDLGIKVSVARKQMGTFDLDVTWPTADPAEEPELVDVGAEAPEASQAVGRTSEEAAAVMEEVFGATASPEKPFNPVEDRPAFLTRQKSA